MDIAIEHNKRKCADEKKYKGRRYRCYSMTRKATEWNNQPQPIVSELTPLERKTVILN
jgi:hypothetical protein